MSEEAKEPAPERNPFALIGGEGAVRDLVERFYNAMEADHPELARLHELDAEGRVSRAARDRFAMFLIGWLGGPQDYITVHGHPRLRMRHARVPVNVAMRDAWTASMKAAMDGQGITGELRVFLDERFADVADFLRNVPG